ncbi:MAG: hypothetical protein LBB72_04725 [Spirochaetaceae bacterium]|jgi:hypothetical protein|nr:hypothetical protein [Spirochaetaceae bacterium]
MANAPVGAAQYLARFGEQRIDCSQYTLAKLGVDRSHCFLKIEDYMILCIPFQFGFKRSLFMASLSKQELVFFQKYVNSIANLSISFLLPGRSEPLNFFIRCTIAKIGQMKGRDNVSIFVVDFKLAPDELVRILGRFLEFQDKLRVQYEDYGKTLIRINPDIARIMGYNMFASIADGTPEGKRIQLLNVSSKVIEFLEAAGSPVRAVGTELNYHLFFKKYRVSVSGKVSASGTLPQGIVRTVSSLDFNPELVEILDDYWLKIRSAPGGITL